MASWASLADAFLALDYPFELVEATARFKVAGGPMLNLLCAPPGVYLVALHVTIEAHASKHCVMLSTLRKDHAPLGKLIDNHSMMKPVYIEKKDLAGKRAAKKAWRLFVRQNPNARDARDGAFALTPTQVFELRRRVA